MSKHAFFFQRVHACFRRLERQRILHPWRDSSMDRQGVRVLPFEQIRCMHVPLKPKTEAGTP